MTEARSPVDISQKTNRTPHKDWATTVKEARSRQIPIGLPSNLKNYFENALKKPPISNFFGGELSQSCANGDGSRHRSHDGKPSRKTVLSHVSRNNPHSRIFFPFQTGDRLQTYMVWLPVDRGTSLPPVPKANERPSDSRNLHSRLNPRNFGLYTDLNQSTYQQEIARTPFIRRKVNMVDHFPNVNSNRTSLHRLKVR